MLATTLTLAALSFAPPTSLVPVRHAATSSRLGGALAFVGDETGVATAAISQDSLLWTKTSHGLSFKDTEVGDGDAPEAGAPVSICYTASVLGASLPPFEEVRRERPLTFVPLEDTEVLELFSEATAGMRVGGKRRVLLPPSSAYAKMDGGATIEFDFEVVGVKSGLDAAAFNLGGGMGAPRVRTAIRLAFFASFVPDILRIVDAVSGGATLDAAGALGQAGDAAAAAAAHPVVLEAANRWAADGLANLF